MRFGQWPVPPLVRPCLAILFCILYIKEAIQKVCDTLGGGGLRDSVTKNHKGEGVNQSVM